MKRRGIQALQRQQRRLVRALREEDPQLANKIASIKLDWYRIKNSSSDDETVDLYIYDEIMSAWMAEWFGGVSAESLIAELNEITASTVNVRINSPGGEVFEAIAIYNALVSHSATINVFVDSLAASAASVIAMAGDKITMMVGSQMMIHDAMGVEMGNAAEMREYAEFLDRQSDNIASIYAVKSGAEADDMRALMLAETWMFAQEAVDLGLADGVYTKPSNADPDDEEEEPAPTEPNEDEETEEGEKELAPEEESEEDDDELENLLNVRHALTNRSWKYNGRKRAPSPVSNVAGRVTDADLDRFIAAMKGKS